MTDLTREGLVELAERCEQVSGPDRELDGDIFLAIRPSSRGRIFNAPKYTASLDAAMTLVPSPAKWSITAGHGDDIWEAWVWLRDGAPPDWRVGHTPALALLSAALRARAMEAGRG